MSESRAIDALLSNLSVANSKNIIDLSFGYEQMSYPELSKRIDEQANEWLRMGVIRGSSVLLILPTSLNLIVHILALMKIGATPSPVSNALGRLAYQHICKNIQPFAIYSKDIVDIDAQNYVDSDHTLIDGCHLLINPENQFREIFQDNLILTTSGSTGFPKSILHKGNNSFLNAELHMQAINENSGGTYLSSLSAFFSYGLIAGIFGALLKAKNIVIPEKPFYPSLWFDYCNQYDISLSSITPGLLKRMLKIAHPFPDYLKKVTIGGEKADLLDVKKLRETFSGEIYLTYGLSEAGPRVFTNEIKEDYTLWPYMGHPLSGVKVSLHAPKNVESVERGELIVDSPTNMLGYIINGQTERDSDFYDHNWLLTGDVCERNDENMFKYIGRSKNIIKCNGEMIYPGLIRNAILLHPDVDDATVEGRENGQIGQEVIAYISLKEGKQMPDLRRFCSKYLRLLEIPREFIESKNVEHFKK